MPHPWLPMRSGFHWPVSSTIMMMVFITLLLPVAITLFPHRWAQTSVLYLPVTKSPWIRNDYFYYYGGAFYIDTGSAYEVVPAPPGAVVTQIPDGALEQDIDGQTYLVFNNTYYQPVSENGEDAYEVVQMN